MTQTVASLALAFIDLITLPMSPRKRDKVFGRVSAMIADRGNREFDTGRGKLKIFALRGPYVASAVANFHTDEPETVRWIDDWVGEGEVLWDVGACLGLYSMYAALRPGVTVVAFEPKAWNFATLVDHVQINAMGDRIMPLCVAMGERNELTQIQISSLNVGGSCNSLLGDDGQFGEQRSVFNQGIVVLSADEMLRMPGVPAPDHIKLDVDGIEGLILAGATETLRSVRSVLVEVEGKNAEGAATRIERPLAAAGLFEDMAFRETWNAPRNRLYVRR